MSTGGPSQVRRSFPNEANLPVHRAGILRDLSKMRKTNVLIILFLLLWLILICKGIQAISITVTGSWSETIDASDLQAGPGSDLNSTYTSASGQISVSIKIGKPKSWEVNVSKSDTNWHPDLGLSVRRTGPGTGEGSISGGTSWLEVNSIPQEFFTGMSKRDDVPVQLEVTGMSVNVPPDDYVTTVIYEIVEI
jgi:hypothetical protein